MQKGAGPDGLCCRQQGHMPWVIFLRRFPDRHRQVSAFDLFDCEAGYAGRHCALVFHPDFQGKKLGVAVFSIQVKGALVIAGGKKPVCNLKTRPNFVHTGPAESAVTGMGHNVYIIAALALPAFH
jgi:hypothetical protein